MMPGSFVPAFQSFGSVTSTQNLMPSRGRVTWKRFNCAPVTSGPTSLFSVIFFDEHFTRAQLWSAGLLLFGAFLAMRVKPAGDPTALEEV